jgi:hypothetical protein
MKQNSGSIVTERYRDSLLMESGAAGLGRQALSALRAYGSPRPEVGAWENDVLLHRLLAMAQEYRDGGWRPRVVPCRANTGGSGDARSSLKRTPAWWAFALRAARSLKVESSSVSKSLAM